MWFCQIFPTVGIYNIDVLLFQSFEIITRHIAVLFKAFYLGKPIGNGCHIVGIYTQATGQIAN